MSKVYKGGSAISGRLTTNNRVLFRTSFSERDKAILFLFALLITLTTASLSWFMVNMVIFEGLSVLVIATLLFALSVELIRYLQSLTLLICSYFAKDPIPMQPGTNLRIAVLTTIVPGKEPFELVARTLKEMALINPGKDNTLDVWLLDEGNDPYIRAQCQAMGVNHFSRKGQKKWNTSVGAFKARTKHGNHNAWRSKNEHNYDIVAQMDPDHVPRRNFLTRTLGYFNDPDVGFVVAPQVYGNIHDSWIAKASAFQAYIFHGIIQRGGNGLKAPLLIGTNHLYRVTAFKQIDGYQDSIIEDHMTSLVIYGAKNNAGYAWKGIYTPDILAVGEGPTSFTDYFNQQKRWAYGIWDIIRTASPIALRKLTAGQRLNFLMLQFFYPSVAISWVVSSITIILYGSIVVEYYDVGIIVAMLWLVSCISSLGLFFWLRKFNLMEHERKDWGVQGMALGFMTIPVYVSAAWQAILRKPLSYAVTAKGNLASPDTIATFMSHIHWIMFSFTSLILMLAYNTNLVQSSVFWTIIHILLCLSPIVIHLTLASKRFSFKKISIRYAKGLEALQRIRASGFGK
jgi:cellulose synthase/poly-beta-1,6-N-acetylglucosamine synthase-like glycosyltransferase